MSYSTVTNLSNSLKRTYADRYFKAFQDDFTPFLDLLDECPDEPTRGTGWFFPFYFYTPQNARVSAEGGPIGTTAQRSEVQGQINAVEFAGWMQISELLKNAGTKDAAWNGGELNRQMKETTEDVTKLMQRMFTISHGTGRLAVVKDNVVSGNSFNAKGNEYVTNLLEGDKVDFVDTDTGGTVQVSARTITAINQVTNVVTFSGAAANLTANWGVYKTGDYGRGSAGLHGLVDDGTFTDTVATQSRTTYPKLKSQVVSNNLASPGTAVALTEDSMRRVCDFIWRRGGTSIDQVMCNRGVMNAFFRTQTGNRRYSVESGQTLKAHLGYKEGDALFSYDKGDLKISTNPNLPARTMYFLSLKDTFYKHTLKKLGWLDEGGSVLRLSPSTTSGIAFDLAWTAIIYAAINISCIAPIWNGRLDDILDDTIAGDTV